MRLSSQKNSILPYESSILGRFKPSVLKKAAISEDIYLMKEYRKLQNIR
jgi:hypothetical protein